MLKQGDEAVKDAKQILYPNVTEPFSPPALDISAFQGEYRNAGYGTLSVKLASCDGKRLIGRRNGFRFHINFEHVTENYWTAIPIWEESDSLLGLLGAEFITQDRKASGMLLRLTPPGAPIDEGTIRFEKVA